LDFRLLYDTEGTPHLTFLQISHDKKNKLAKSSGLVDAAVFRREGGGHFESTSSRLNHLNHLNQSF